MKKLILNKSNKKLNSKNKIIKQKINLNKLNYKNLEDENKCETNRKFIKINGSFYKNLHLKIKNNKFKINTNKNYFSFTKLNNSTNKNSYFKKNIKNITKNIINIKIPYFLSENEILLIKNIKDKYENIIVKKIKDELKFMNNYKKKNNLFENYELIKLIGKGNFGKVYLAKQKITNTKVAIKIISKNNFNYNKYKHKFIKEIEILNKTFNHDNIIKLFENFENDKNFYLIFEYCDRGDLYNFIKKLGLLNENQTIEIIHQILLGLKYIHNLKIIHRDIKLENILIKDNLNIKICDFGISLIKKENKIIKDTSGTPCYLSPEILLREGKIDYNSDIWSLGVLLYAIYFGKFPFYSTNIQTLYKLIWKGNFKTIQNKPISKDLKNLLSKMLTYDIKKRESAKELLNNKLFTNKVFYKKIKNKNKEKEDRKMINYLIAYNCLLKLGIEENILIDNIKEKQNTHISSLFYALLNRL